MTVPTSLVHFLPLTANKAQVTRAPLMAVTCLPAVWLFVVFRRVKCIINLVSYTEREAFYLQI